LKATNETNSDYSVKTDCQLLANSSHFRYDKEMKSVSRRTVLKSAATAAAGMGPLRGFGEVMMQRRPIVGTGEFTFEVIHDWLEAPKHLLFGDTHGVCQDSHGRIYIAHTVNGASVSKDAICVFDSKGKFISSWGSVFAGGAHGLDVRKEGRDEFLYHCDTRRRLVVKTDLVGRVIWEKGVPMESVVYQREDQWCPTNVAFAPDGDLFVGDGYGSSYIHKYSMDGEYKGVIAKPGSGEGEVRQPHGLWVDDRQATPRLVVADRANRRIQYLTLEGKHLGFVTEGIRLPCHFKTKDSFLLVPDLESIVTVLDKNDKVVASLCDGRPSSLRDQPRNKFVPGQFVHPHSAMWLNKRDILVVEWVPIGRVTLLKNVNFGRD
jgi:hypothetical protein